MLLCPQGRDRCGVAGVKDGIHPANPTVHTSVFQAQLGPCFSPRDRPHWPRGSPNFSPFVPTRESGTGQTELLAPSDHVW